MKGLRKEEWDENTLTFIYDKNNVSVIITVHKDILYLEEFTAQYDNNIPRARKGLAYEMLCRLVHKLIKYNYIDENKNIELNAVTLIKFKTEKEENASQKKLIEYYMSKGFKPVAENDYRKGIKMYQPIKSFLKMCGELTKKQIRGSYRYHNYPSTNER